MKKAIDVFKDMKSVMIFDPEDSQEETNRKWGNWWNHNQKKVPFSIKPFPVLKKHGVCSMEKRNRKFQYKSRNFNKVKLQSVGVFFHLPFIVS